MSGAGGGWAFGVAVGSAGGGALYLYSSGGQAALLVVAVLALVISAVVALAYSPGVSEAIATFAHHRWPAPPPTTTPAAPDFGEEV